MAQMNLSASSQILLLNSVGPGSRKVHRIGNCVVKAYSLASDAWYEYNALSTVTGLHPANVAVPVPIGIRQNTNRTFVFTEYVEGYSLVPKVFLAMFVKKSRDIDLFHDLGIALKSFHMMEADGFDESEIPGEPGALKARIEDLAKGVAGVGVLDPSLTRQLLNRIGGIEIDDRIFSTVTLHGDFHFWNLLISRGKPVFLDLSHAKRGPCHRDLATFSLCLWSSLCYPLSGAKRLRYLAHAFLSGYYGQDFAQACSTGLARSVELSELYEALREIDLNLKVWHKRGYETKVWAKLKIRRLKTVIENVILPHLVTRPEKLVWSTDKNLHSCAVRHPL